MFKKKKNQDRENEGQPQMPSDGDLFGVPPAEQPDAGDVFSSLAGFTAESFATETLEDRIPRPATLPPIPLHPSQVSLHLDRLSSVQKILVAGIIVISATLAYTVVSRMGHRNGAQVAPSPGPKAELSLPRSQSATGSRQPASQTWDAKGDGPRLGMTSPRETEPLEAIEPSIPSPEPLSLQLANKLYENREYEHAFVSYDKLHRRLGAAEENRPLRDFLVLRMAMCSNRSGDATQADALFRTVSLSRLPILRALARYNQSVMLIERKRYLEAAAKAYQTISLIGVADIDAKWVSAVQQQCGFLIAEAMSRNLLSLSDADANLPAALWGRHPNVDPFVEMEEPQLRIFLASGSEKLDEAALSPQIHVAAVAGQWSVVCNGASIEELLARFASNAGLNLRWADGGQAAAADENIRKRPVYLYLPSATVQQVSTIAAGSVGLLAQLDSGGSNITVRDPTSYSSLSEHTKFLADESISLWQRFLLAADTDQRAPNGHFAVAMLQTVGGQLDEAISEYKLVANRFPKHALAPYALLESGRLRVRLRDYVGAHADLKQLVEVYPETDLADTAYRHLADATMKAGLFEEAAGLYQRVYNLGLSAESQAASALGTGLCSSEMGNHEETARWLNRYVTLVRDQNRPEFHTACLLLGKAYLALHKPQQAHVALNLALNGDLSRQQYVEVVAVLVKAYIEQGQLVEALQTIESTAGWQLSQQESIELLLLRVQVLRSIGLVNKAIALLEEKGQFLPSPELKGAVAIELAACYINNDEIETARKTLSDAFALVGPGPLAQQIGRELARTCLRLGQASQAVSVCSQLLEHASAAEKPPVLNLLAEAYRKQGQYDRAMAAMLDRNGDVTDPNLVRTSPGVKVTQ